MNFDRYQEALQTVDECLQSKPSLRVLPPELESVPELPIDALPEAIINWVRDVSRRMCCPAELIALPMLVALGSLAARKAAIRPQENTDWTERPNLWGICIGRPGLMKSPAQAAGLSALRSMESASSQNYSEQLDDYERESRYEKLKHKALESRALAELKKNPNSKIEIDESEAVQPPVHSRFIVNNLTYESAGEILSSNPGGVLLERDELGSFLKSLSSEEQSEARGFYLQSWSGGPYLFDRIGRGHIRINDLRLSIIGGIQPGPISRLINQANRFGTDGLIERFLIAWPDDPGEWQDIDLAPSIFARSDAYAAFEHLYQMDPVMEGAVLDASGRNSIPFFKFDKTARYLFLDWRQELEASLRGEQSPGMYESALAKFRKHVPALALILHLSDRRKGTVGVESITKALQLSDYFQAHANRAYTSGIRPVVRASNLILNRMKQSKLENDFTARRVYRTGWEGLADRELVESALDMLVEYGWLSEVRVSDGGRGTSVYSLTAEAQVKLEYPFS